MQNIKRIVRVDGSDQSTGRSPGFKTADFSYPLITMHDALKQVFHTRQSEL